MRGSAKKLKEKKVLKKILIVLIYVYLFISLSYFTTDTLSRYFTILPESSSSLDIAKWEVYLDTTDNTADVLDLVSGGNTNKNYILKVTSNSDVAVNYSIEVSDLEPGLSVLLDGNNSGTVLNDKVIFENAGSFDAGNNNAINEHILTFSTTLGTGDIDGNSVKIDVIFTQVSLNE